MRGLFAIKADEKVYQFGIDWDENFHEMDDLVEKAQHYVSGYISDSVDDAIKILIQRNVFDVDSEKFIRNYYINYNSWNDSFNTIIDKYAKIVLDSKQLEEYKRHRELKSGAFVGGVFASQAEGIEGAEAVVFANIAISTLNILSSGYSIVADEIESFKKKDVLFKSVDTRKILNNGLHESILNIHYALLDALHDYSLDLNIRPISENDFGKAESTFNNLNKGMLYDLNKIKIINDILACNPYYTPIYEYILINYGDQDGSLERVGTNFFIDVKKLKTSQVRGFVNLQTEQDAKKSLEEILRIGKYFNCSVDEFVEEIEKKLNKFDLQSRTFLGIQYPTISAAEDARNNTNKNVNFFKENIIWFIAVLMTFSVVMANIDF